MAWAGDAASTAGTDAPTDAVAYDGLPVRRGPLNWSQRWTWDIIQELVPLEQRINVALAVPVGSDRRRAEVLAVLTDLVTRFETLRTVFPVDADGEPEQVVQGDGVIPVDVREAAGQRPEDLAEMLKDAVAGHRFDLGAGPLVSFGIVTAGGRPSQVVLGLSNLVVDGWSLELLRRELSNRLARAAGPASGADRDASADWQPLDQAMYERTEEARAGARASHEYWREQLPAIRAIPPPMRRPAVETPRYWCARVTSVALARAGHAVAARVQVPPSAVLLAGLAALVGLRTGQPALGLSLTASNRYQPGRRRSVGKFFQAAPVYLDLDAPTFAELAARVAGRMLRAARYGHSDPLELARLVHGEGPHRGAHLALPVVFDYHSPVGEPEPLEKVAAQDLPRLAIGSRLWWSDAVERENMSLFAQVQRFDAEAWLLMWIDTQYLSRADLAAVVFGLERLLMVAAVSDIRLSQLGAVTGVAPGCRAE